MQGRKGSKGTIVSITVESNLYASAREYADGLDNPISFAELVRELLRATPGIRQLLKLKKGVI